jgi:hypothetical protein
MRASRKYLDLAKPLVDYKSNKRLAPGVGESSIFKLNLYDDSVSQSVASGLSYRFGIRRGVLQMTSDCASSP